MHLTPITPVDTYTHGIDAPIWHGTVGSAARLAVLFYLANRPLGATREVLREVTGLDNHDIVSVLRGLSSDHRIVCDHPGPLANWHVPAARAGLTPGALVDLRTAAAEAPATAPAQPSAAQAEPAA